MHIKTALFGLNFDAFEYSWDETGGATRIGLALLLRVALKLYVNPSLSILKYVSETDRCPLGHMKGLVFKLILAKSDQNFYALYVHHLEVFYASF